MTGASAGWRRATAPKFGQALLRIAALGVVTTAAVVLMGPFLAFLREEPGQAPGALLGLVLPLAFIAAGTLVLLEPGQRLNGSLLVLFGLPGVVTADGSAVLSPTVLLVIALGGEAAWVCLIWVLLRYPNQRLARGYERAFLASYAIWMVGGWLLVTITWIAEGSPPEQLSQWPLWLPNHDMPQIATVAYSVGLVALSAGFIALMMLRVRRTRGLDRATYWPTYVAAGAMSVSGVAVGLSGVRPSEFLLVLHKLALLIIPIAFLYGVVRRRLARSRVGDLVMQVSEATSPAAVQAALRRTMSDPALTVSFWSADLDGYVDVQGQSATDEPAKGQVALPVNNRNGEPLAVVHVDASVEHHRDLLDAALAASSLALENAALHASLLARLAEVQESRARLAETAVAERRRIERDLHDGAQQALLALGMTLGRAQAAADRTTAADLLTKARGELTAALEELRDLARGLHPAVLTQLGLGPALEVVAERLPVAVSLDVPARRWPEAVETTAYFVACEAFANAVKHADATQVRLTVADQPDRLLLRVIDDGKGGACATEGHGLLNIRDRAAAMGGSVSIRSGAGLGTVVAADLPCG